MSMSVATNAKMRLIRMFYSSDAHDAVTDMLRERYLFSESGSAVINKNAFWDDASKDIGRGTWELMLFADEAVADRLIADVREVTEGYPFNDTYPYGVPDDPPRPT